MSLHPNLDDFVANHDDEWWRNAVTYQVYPRSFADSDGDGLGDLTGLISRVSYLQALGVDAIWLSPFYPSELADGGYDVSDPRDVDPRLGSLAVFDELVAQFHAVGIRVIVDIVPNHSSDKHRWFEEALRSAPGSPARDRYIFRDGRGHAGELPPNDWPSHFGPTCWSRVADGQWYLHLFAPEQPDFNWDNEEVRADAIETLRFWGDRGVDGFRVDVAHGLVKDLREPYAKITSFSNDLIPLDGSHPLFDRDDVHEIYASWRNVFNEYSPPLTAVAEAWVPTERRPRYAAKTGLGQTFNFDLLTATWDAEAFRTIIEKNLELAERSGSSSTWVLSNHDVVRHASRYGLPNDTNTTEWLLTDGQEPSEDRELGLTRARGATMLMLALPGAAYLYQGEELGLPEVSDLPRAALEDPIWLRTGGAVKGRDGCRVPLPWTATGPSFGFGSADAHLPQPASFARHAVAEQETQPDSTLRVYRQLLDLRKQLRHEVGLTWLDSPKDVLLFQRGESWLCILNASSVAVELPEGRVIATSGALHGGVLAPGQAAWLLRSPHQ